MRFRSIALMLFLGTALLIGLTPIAADHVTSATPAPVADDSQAAVVDGTGFDPEATLEADPFYGLSEFSTVAKECQFCKQKYACNQPGATCNDQGCSCKMCSGALRCAR